MVRIVKTAEFNDISGKRIKRLFSPLVKTEIRAYEYVMAVLLRRGCTEIRFV